jgi:hypothetical protein
MTTFADFKDKEIVDGGGTFKLMDKHDQDYVKCHGVKSTIFNYFNGVAVDIDVGQPFVLTASGAWRTAKILTEADKYFKYYVFAGSSAHVITFVDNSDIILSKVQVTGASAFHEGVICAPTNAVAAYITTLNSQIAASFYYYEGDTIGAKMQEIYTLGRTLIVDNTQATDESSLIFATILEAIQAYVPYDIIKIFGSDANPYNEQDLKIPDNATLRGVGKPVINGYLADSTSVATIESTSTIDTSTFCFLENLIVKAQNMRYAIHDDFSEGLGSRKYINCEFHHLGNKEAYDYQAVNDPGNEVNITRAMSAYGGGTKSGDFVLAKGCLFKSKLRGFSQHNNTGFDAINGASITELIDCECVSEGVDRDGTLLAFFADIHIQSLTSNVKDQVLIRNCKFKHITFDNNQTIDIFVNGENIKQVYNVTGAGKLMNYNWTELDITKYIRIPSDFNSMRNVSAGTLSRGKAVKLSGLGFDLFTSSDSAGDFYGILMADTLTGGVGDVKYKGYLPYKYFIASNAEIAEDLDISVNATGDFIQDSSHIISKTYDNNQVLIS